GTVVAVGSNTDGQCDIGGSTDITQVDAGGFHTVGLRNDGTVIAVGDNEYGQCDVGGWTDIIQVDAGEYHTVGFKDGSTVIAVGNNDFGQCDVGTWTDIAQVATGGYHTVGLESDGTVVAVGHNDYGQCGGAADFGIVYLDSTGRIADLTVENIIPTDLGAGVAIISAVGTSVVDLSGVTVDKSTTGVAILNAEANLDGCTLTETDAGIVIGLPFDGFDPSTVNIQGSTIADNYETGIWVCDDSILEAHFNNIVGNGLGVWNDGGETVDAVYNWWGDASGPYHETLNPDGTGDEVSDNVDFEPWLGVGTVTKTVTNSTVDAVTEADTEVEVRGTATVTITRYATNPHPPTSTLTLDSYTTPAPTDFVPLDIWRDVRVINTKPGTEIEIRLYYTDGEVAAANVTEGSLRLLWWNETDYVECSPDTASGVNMIAIVVDNHKYSGYMWAKITGDTTPSLTDLGGTPWGGYGHPTEKEGICFIATAAYCTDTTKELDTLREFRDTVMLPNSLGAEFVSFYYRTSPPVADFISQHEVLRTAVRVGFVDPIVKLLTSTHDLWSERSP
ncbi:MAG: CFI-box-CTERM domain-containing protein, partial [Dehalococcoidia bacterium]